jgi:hypothetical protein
VILKPPLKDQNTFADFFGRAVTSAGNDVSAFQLQKTQSNERSEPQMEAEGSQKKIEYVTRTVGVVSSFEALWIETHNVPNRPRL